MKTSVSLDRDAYVTVKDFAAAKKTTPRKVLSELVRDALPAKAKTVRRNGIRIFAKAKAKLVRRNGFLLIPKIKGSEPVTTELINRLRDEDP